MCSHTTFHGRRMLLKAVVGGSGVIRAVAGSGVVATLLHWLQRSEASDRHKTLRFEANIAPNFARPFLVFAESGSTGHDQNRISHLLNNLARPALVDGIPFLDRTLLVLSVPAAPSCDGGEKPYWLAKLSFEA